MWPPQLMKGSLHCDLLSYWFNCLSPPSCACSYTRSKSSLWLLPLQTNPISPQTTVPLSHSISLISLCLMSGTKELTSGDPPLTTLLNHGILTYQRLWWKRPDLRTTVSLSVHYGGIPEDSLSLRVIVHVETLKWSHSMEMYIWMKAWEKNANWGRKTAYVAWKIEWVQCSDTNMTVFLVLVNFPNSTDYDKARWKKGNC